MNFVDIGPINLHERSDATKKRMAIHSAAMKPSTPETAVISNWGSYKSEQNNESNRSDDEP